MIRIITDTTAGLTQEILDEFKIPMVPQYIHFGEEAYKGYFEMSVEEFFIRQAAASELPKTSAPSVGDFVVLFEEILGEDPYATILCIHPSTDVSGTVRSARPAAAQFPDADIRIFDTRGVSITLGLMVWDACTMVRNGATIDEVLAMLEHARDTATVYFVVDTLEYLAKGGRIGRASHLLGSLLDIKPILAMADGVVESHSKARTRKRSLQVMHDMAVEQVGDAPGLRMGVAHAVCEDEGLAFYSRLINDLNPEFSFFGEVTPSIGVHAGPGTLAVGWYHFNP